MARVESEAGIIATLIHHPEFSYYSEQLLPNHFTNEENRYIYQAICSLARDGITTIDPYNIIQALSAKEATRRFADELSIDQLYTLMDNSDSIARNTVEEYKLLVNNVMDAAFRRDTFQQLKECQKLCTQPSEENIEQKIYKMLDDVMMEFSATNEVPPYKDVVDKCWEEIKGRQGAGYAGIPFKFPALNDYATIERGELFIFGAEQKQGKSMMLLNCAVDLLKQDYAVLYLDSELNTRLFTSRILAHLSGIEYKRLTSGNYSDEEEKRILDAKEWLKTRKFTHIYIVVGDENRLFQLESREPICFRDMGLTVSFGNGTRATANVTVTNTAVDAINETNAAETVTAAAVNAARPVEMNYRDGQLFVDGIPIDLPLVDLAMEDLVGVTTPVTTPQLDWNATGRATVDWFGAVPVAATEPTRPVRAQRAARPRAPRAEEPLNPGDTKMLDEFLGSFAIKETLQHA